MNNIIIIKILSKQLYTTMKKLHVQNLQLKLRRAPTKTMFVYFTVDFRNVIVFFWAETLAH